MFVWQKLATAPLRYGAILHALNNAMHRLPSGGWIDIATANQIFNYHVRLLSYDSCMTHAINCPHGVFWWLTETPDLIRRRLGFKSAASEAVSSIRKTRVMQFMQ